MSAPEVGGRASSGRSARPLRVLFICTGNSARSQIAEALLARKGQGRFEAASAGAHPVDRVHPQTVEALRAYGIDWTGRTPKGVDAVCNERWDFVITVCDQAKESCPTIPGHPVFAHWGMPDPAAVGDPERQRRAFNDVVLYMSRRIDLLLALPIASLERRALELRVQAIAHEERAERGEAGTAGGQAARTPASTSA